MNECESNPCQHGGMCADEVNAFTCDCTDTEFEGVYCELERKDDITDFVWNIILYVEIGLIILLAFPLIFLLNDERKHKQKNAAASDST